MPNYQNGKIYKITGTDTEGNNLVYIGSTTQKLCVRFAGHKVDAKTHNVSSKKVVECSNSQITLLELFPCNSREELIARERYYFDLNECVNFNRPYVSIKEGKEEMKEYNKQYYIGNVCKFKEYYIGNVDKIKGCNKQYKTKNADKIKESRKQYYNENSDKIKEYKKQYYIQNKEYAKQYYIQKKERLQMGLEDVRF